MRKLQEVGDLGRYEAFVLGSGMYLGTRLKEARRFLDTRAAEYIAEFPDLPRANYGSVRVAQKPLANP